MSSAEPTTTTTTTPTPIGTDPVAIASPPAASTISPQDADASVPPSRSTAPAGTPAIRLCREHPRNSFYLLGLVMAVPGLIAGWVAFLTHEGWIETHSNNPGIDMGLLAVNGVFLICLLVAVTALLRQTYYTHLLLRSILHPESYTSSVRNRDRTSGSAGRNVVGGTSDSALGVLPSWLLPRPPAYGDIVRGTGDVEDQAAYHGEGLPKYGDTRGSRLLLAGIRLSRADSRTSSRGDPNPTDSGPERRHSVGEVDGDGDSDGVVSSGGETQMVALNQQNVSVAERQAEVDTSLRSEKARYTKP